MSGLLPLVWSSLGGTLVEKTQPNFLAARGVGITVYWSHAPYPHWHFLFESQTSLLKKLFLLKYSYNVLLISAVQQSDPTHSGYWSGLHAILQGIFPTQGSNLWHLLHRRQILNHLRQRLPGSLIPGLGRSPGEGNGYPLRILASRIPWTEEPGGLQSMGLQRVGCNWAANTFTFTYIHSFHILFHHDLT